MRRLPAWAIVAVVALAYPLVVLGGGGPHFPSRSECVQPATHDGEIQAVFGSFDTEREAVSFREDVARYGWASAVVEAGACGKVRVVVHGITTLDGGRGLLEEAASVGLHPTLEQVR